MSGCGFILSYGSSNKRGSSLDAPLRSVSLHCDRLVGLVVKASASRAEDHGFESRLRWGWVFFFFFFCDRVIPVTSKLALQWLPCQAPGVIGSALGLVGPVSVYCDWVR